MEGSARQRILKCASENPTWTAKQVAEHIKANAGYVSSEMSDLRRRGLLPPSVDPRGAPTKVASSLSSPPPALNGASHVVAQLRAVRAEYAAKIAKIDQAIAALS